MLTITLKDGSKKQIENGATALDAAKGISEGLARAALACEIDGELCDLMTKIDKDCALAILTFDDEGGRKAFRHTASHVMAQAVKRLYPEIKLAIGPAIENGFYYDFDAPKPILPEDLEKIEVEMKKIVKEDLPLERFELERDEAIEFMQGRGEPYKVELIENLPGDATISFYKQGEFVDLCAGPHIPSTGKIKAIKLTSCTGAYWHGDSNNKMLQRIYGTAFLKQSELDEYLNMLEEAKKRDHRKLGRELDLFAIYEEGPGFPFFMPKGMVLRNELESFWRQEHRRAGYEEVRTPIILNQELWHRSGHWDHYKENMYTTKIDDEDYAIKPMNCPGGMLAFKRKMHSYRDLPERMAELGIVHRHELSGALMGLMRVRCFTQDDAHLFMTPDQIQDEVIGVINLIDRIYKVFGFSYKVELSTRPENSMGSDEQWERATEALRNALEKKGMEYVINEGDGAFYGPKIDFHLKDSLGRTWQCGTIQLDFQMPERFDLTYITPEGGKARPVMVHRTAFGSIERFIGILTEHFAGAFPLWLSPVQVKILPITERNHGYSNKLKDMLFDENIRVETDERNEKIGYKIREAQMEKVPYMLVIGDKEEEAGTIAVRNRKDGKTETMSMDDFIEKLKKEIKSRTM